MTTPASVPVTAAEAAEIVPVTPTKSLQGPLNVTVMPTVPKVSTEAILGELTKATFNAPNKSTQPTQPEIKVTKARQPHRHVAVNPKFAKLVATAEAAHKAKKAETRKKA